MSISRSAQVRLRGLAGGLRLEAAFELPVGVTVLSGPSGAGKSTLLRAVAGLERFDGLVRVGEEVWQDADRFLPPHRRSVGYVFQHAVLLPHLSVRRNLDYGRRRAGVAAPDLERTAAMLGLTPLLDRATSRLSGGERQRVAIARALLTRPRLLLMDEPLSGLDAQAKADLLVELKKVFTVLAVPVLYVSHDVHEMAGFAALTLSLDDGRISPAPPRSPVSLVGRSQGDIEALALAAIRAGLPTVGAD